MMLQRSEAWREKGIQESMLLRSVRDIGW